MEYSFREKRTGTVRVIGGVDGAVDAIKALTIYPWAYEPVGFGAMGSRELMPLPAEEVAEVAAHSAAAHQAALSAADVHANRKRRQSATVD
jgi:hypothetical protein